MYFHTNCSLPKSARYDDSFPLEFIFAYPPNFRGTLNILWSSLSALLLCTWSIQHLTLPPQRKMENWKQRFRAKMAAMSHKLTWMLITLISPEFLVGKALVDWAAAKGAEREMKRFAEMDDAPWTRTHGFYANMGGFVVRFTERTPIAGSDETSYGGKSQLVWDSWFSDRDQLGAEGSEFAPGDPEAGQSSIRMEYLPLSRSRDRSTSNASPRTLENELAEYDDILTDLPNQVKGLSAKVDDPNVKLNRYIAILAMHAYKEETGDHLYSFISKARGLARLQGSAWALDASQLYLVREMGLISAIPSVSEEDIIDQSKGDFIVKSLAAAQVIYLVTQLIVRAADGLPSTQLEVAMVAFATSALFIYFLYLNKPQDVNTPRYIEAVRHPTPAEMIQLVNAGPSRLFWLPWWDKISYTVPNFAIHFSGGPDMPLLFSQGSLIGSALFGALHCAAWNFQFITWIEMIIWRVAALWLAGMGLLGALVLQVTWGRFRGGFGFGGLTVVLVAGMSYAVARMYLLGEVFVTLFFAEEGYLGRLRGWGVGRMLDKGLDIIAHRIK